MLYIYMNNYRGFSNTLIPLNKCTFLVGENSTGKSSFLALLQLITRPDFWFFPRFDKTEDLQLNSFSDIVSANSENLTFFDVGIINVSLKKNGSYDLDVAINRFIEQNTMPTIATHFQLQAGKETHIRFNKKDTQYLVEPSPPSFETETTALEYFWHRLHALNDATDFKSLPQSFPPNPPLAVALSLIRAIESGEKPKLNEFKAEIPMAIDLTWIAPIRTRPKRIYEGFSRDYSAEGEHSPFVLKRNLKSKKFADRLAAFGDASGLFETVITHTFGRGERNPFEVLIRLRGTNLNINNVGYGVSQALPLVVEFLAREKGRTFAVQQPEVHLHPRAQAALGGLLFELAVEREHSFLVETHSDYLIDRFRTEMSRSENPPKAQVLFFARTEKGNTVTPIEIAQSGQYPKDQPKAFREFFINEEMLLLSL
ncbi:MAG: ATP-binding protein [Nitrosomonas sp.]|uniref:AAA family ATPase n=1 Tax=Nitrosomonas sp. TaxID=42353 RepID=UPI0032EB979F